MVECMGTSICLIFVSFSQDGLGPAEDLSNGEAELGQIEAFLLEFLADGSLHIIRQRLQGRDKLAPEREKWLSRGKRMYRVLTSVDLWAGVGR